MNSAAAGWETFFSAEAGAAATLSGLLFVAVSINLTRILEFQHLPGIAAEGLVVILSVLGVSVVSLTPHISAARLGMSFLVIWSLVMFLLIKIQWRARHSASVEYRLWVRLMTSELPTLPIAIAGVMLLLGRPDALDVLVAGTLLSFLGGVLNAWIMLVEINR